MEYSNLINRILEVEHSARAIADENLQRQASLDSEMAEERERIMQRYMDRAKQRLEKLALDERKKKEQTLCALDKRQAEAGRKIEAAYTRYGENWVNTLFQQVVGEQ